MAFDLLRTLNLYSGITFVVNAIQVVLDKFYVRLIDLILRNLIHTYVKRQSSSYHSSKHMDICGFTIEGIFKVPGDCYDYVANFTPRCWQMHLRILLLEYDGQIIGII
uniref:Uncharacterized protein n=1 Tax=Glossina pallidipes TaxID=7398 RepID=A0A1B0AG74_GLOPL